MLSMLGVNWWIFVVRGIAAIAFGVLAFIWPGITLVVLIALFGAYALVDGGSLLIAILRGEPAVRRHGWSVAIMGAVGVIAGIVAFVWPGLTALSLLYVVAFWSIVIGVFQVLAAIRLRREIEGELWMGLGGAVSILFGAYLAVFPGAGLLSLIWIIAVWSIIFGVSSLILGIRLRAHGVPTAIRQI